DEIGARRREEKLALGRSQELEQRRRSLGIELARNIVEKQDREHTARLRDARELRAFHRERDGAVLSLRCDDARRVSVERHGQIVEVGSEAGSFALCILSPRRSQALPSDRRFVGAAWAVLS